MRAEDHNAVLRRAYRRVDELEPKLAAVIEPILREAGVRAASAFQARATDHLTASLHQDFSLAGPDTARGTMVAVYPRGAEAAALAEDGGEPTDVLHATLAYLGKTDGPLDRVKTALARVAGTHGPLDGQVGGVGVFGNNGNGHPAIALPSVPGLTELRVDVTRALAAAGIEYGRDWGYVPHLTLAYRDTPATPDVAHAGKPLHFDGLWIVRGDTERVELPLTGSLPLTAAGGGIERELASVAETHRPDGGYGDTWWRASDATVFWNAADWTTNEEIAAARDAFLAVDGVERFDYDAEVGHPDGRDGWTKVWPESLTAAGTPDWTAPAPDEVLDVAALVRKLRDRIDPVRQAVVETVMIPALNGAGLSFDITNPLTKRVLAQAGSQVTGIAETTQLNVMRAIRHGYENGLSIPDTAKVIEQGMADAAGWRSVLIARTEMVGAAAGGSLAATQIVADATGTTYLKTWLTAPGARFPRHEDYDGLDGQTVGLDAPFDVGGEQLQFPGDPSGSPDNVCNCVPGWMLVQMPSLRAATRRWYEGDLVEVRLASGDVLAATPNHPVLRSDGSWVSIGDVREGDDLVCADLVGDEMAAPDEQRPPTEISEVYRLANDAGISERIVVSPGNFHGDASVHGEVDVIPIDGSLLVDEEAASDEQVEQLGRALAHAAGSCSSGFDGAVFGDFWGSHVRAALASASLVGRNDKRATLVVGHAGEPETVSLRRATRRDAELLESSNDDGPIGVEGLADREHAFAALVTSEQVVEVECYPFAGHVFNLDTGQGWYTAGTVATRNCRCTLVYTDQAGDATDAPAGVDVPAE